MAVNDAALGDPLIEESQAYTWCGGLVDCNKLLSWRGAGSDRRLWKAFCSVAMVAEMGFYVYVVYVAQASPWLMLFGTLTTLKMLIETWGQDTPNWVCPGGPLMFLVVYVLILPGIIYADGICTSNQDISFPGRDLLGVFLFFFGSSYALTYEMGRFKWKARPENKGKLHTEGLAAYCIHPNYFADLFTYTGWALCAGTTCALSAPAGMVWSFVLFVIPNSDAYLAQRYWREWDDYSRRVATFIPGLHSQIGLQVLAWACFAVAGILGGKCAGQCDVPDGLF
jgi:protein-S-isoprenylcysteine O-methyltransferase Ste14